MGTRISFFKIRYPRSSCQEFQSSSSFATVCFNMVYCILYTIVLCIVNEDHTSYLPCVGVLFLIILILPFIRFIYTRIIFQHHFVSCYNVFKTDGACSQYIFLLFFFPSEKNDRILRTPYSILQPRYIHSCIFLPFNMRWHIFSFNKTVFRVQFAQK